MSCKGLTFLELFEGVLQESSPLVFLHEILELYYSKAFDGSHSLTLENTSDEEKYSSAKDYEGDEAQENKGVDTLENNENFDCYTINNSSILQSMLDDLANYKY